MSIDALRTSARYIGACLGLALAGCAAHDSDRVTPEPAPMPEPAPASPSQPAAGSATSKERSNPLLVSAQPSWHAPWTECVGIRVHIVSLSPGDPEHSAASISTTANGRAHVVHPGQWIGEWEVLAITDDWTGMKPGVWLRRDAEVCRALLSGSHERAEAAPSSNKRVKKRRAR